MTWSRLAICALLVVAAAALSSIAGGGTPSTSSGADMAQPARPTRFACYGAQFSSFAPRKLTLVDGVAGRLLATVYVPYEVCAPAATTDGGLAGSVSYLTCYRMRPTTRFVSKLVRARDEFRGASTIVLWRPSKLCVPSARVDEGGPSKPSSSLDSFTCYPARPTRTLTRDDVAVVDEFDESADSISGPRDLCTPAWSPSRPAATGRPLTCYSVKSTTKGRSVVVRNTFGFLKAALGPRSRLCVNASFA